MAKGGSTTQNTGPTGATATQQGLIYGAADQAAAEPMATSAPGQVAIAQAESGATGASAGAALGEGALSGNAADVAQLSNPYTSQVIDAMLSQWGQLRGNTDDAIKSGATGAGAYGGSRAADAQGVADADLNLGIGQNISGLLSQGYQGAIGQAGTLANLGLQGNNQLSSIGAYQNSLAQQAQQYKVNTLKNGVAGVPGSSSTTTQTQVPLGTQLVSALGAGAGLFGNLATGGAASAISPALGSSLMNPNIQGSMGSTTPAPGPNLAPLSFMGSPS